MRVCLHEADTRTRRVGWAMQGGRGVGYRRLALLQQTPLRLTFAPLGSAFAEMRPPSLAILTYVSVRSGRSLRGASPATGLLASYRGPPRGDRTRPTRPASAQNPALPAREPPSRRRRHATRRFPDRFPGLRRAAKTRSPAWASLHRSGGNFTRRSPQSAGPVSGARSIGERLARELSSAPLLS